MSERIDAIEYTSPEPGTRLFLDGPGEFLVQRVVDELLKLPVWQAVFGEFIDPYMRMDYPARAFPALRLYNDRATKETESWFIEGNLTADVIFPASIRRSQNQQLADSISSALLQQFRSTTFYNAVSEGIGVPGVLNELGKRFSIDKSLAFQWSEENLVPLTQIEINFKIDLRKWDDYLELSDRTKDKPFERTLGDLKRIVTQIQALRDDDEEELTVKADQDVT